MSEAVCVCEECEVTSERSVSSSRLTVRPLNSRSLVPAHNTRVSSAVCLSVCLSITHTRYCCTNSISQVVLHVSVCLSVCLSVSLSHPPSLSLNAARSSHSQSSHPHRSIYSALRAVWEAHLRQGRPADARVRPVSVPPFIRGHSTRGEGAHLSLVGRHWQWVRDGL